MSGIAIVKLQGEKYECSTELAEAIDAALEQNAVKLLDAVEAAIDGHEAEVPAEGTDTGEAFYNVLDAYHAALEQARGFRDAWKVAAKRWRGLALAHEMDAAVTEGAAQFERWQREKAQAKLEQARRDARYEAYGDMLDAVISDWRERYSEPMTIGEVESIVRMYVEKALEQARREAIEQACAAICTGCMQNLEVWRGQEGGWWHKEAGKHHSFRCKAAAIREGRKLWPAEMQLAEQAGREKERERLLKVAQGLEEHAEEELAVARYEGQCGWAQGFRRAAQRMQEAIREADDDNDVS
jgi:hypothetical protein